MVCRPPEEHRNTDHCGNSAGGDRCPRPSAGSIEQVPRKKGDLPLQSERLKGPQVARSKRDLPGNSRRGQRDLDKSQQLLTPRVLPGNGSSCSVCGTVGRTDSPHSRCAPARWPGPSRGAAPSWPPWGWAPSAPSPGDPRPTAPQGV